MMLEMTIPDRTMNVNGPGSARAVRVLVVAHYASVRAGLHSLLDGQPGITVVGQVRGLEEVEALLPDQPVDVIVYDQFDEDGGRMIAAVSGRVVGLVVLADDTVDLRVLAETPLNGWAHLNKETGREELAAAVRAVAAGLIVMDHASVTQADFGTRSLLRSGLEPLEETTLTARELEVLKLMASGLPNKVIAARLKISANTVKFHVASILSKLGAASRTEAVTMGVRKGLLAL